MQNTKKLLFVLFCLPVLFYGQRKQSKNSLENIIVYTKDGSFNKKLKKEKIKLNQLLNSVNHWFHLNEDYSFQQISSRTDKLGFTHINFEEYYKGVKVENGILMVHLKAGYVNSINGQIHALKDVSSSLKVSKRKALELAKSKLKVSKLIQKYPVETIYLRVKHKDSFNFKLAQKVRIDSNEPFEMCHLYLDANSGEILSKVNLFYNEDTSGTADILYGGVVDITCESHNGSYRLRESVRNIQTFDGTNAENTIEIDGIPNAEDYVSSTTDWVMSGNNQTALDVHWGMEKTYDFYLNAMNRNSYDDEGGVIKQYINPPHYQEAYGNTQNNASAYGAPYNIMLYGMGDGTEFNPIVALDVAGHEFTHLVVNNNGNGGLVYQGESGALNESFADIFGTCIEFYSNINPDWLIGEDIYVEDFTYMRSLQNPNSKDHPDTYDGNYWINPNDSFDYGGVHINSSVQNFWFYLLSEGGSGVNDKGDSYSVTGIGIEDARSIAYRNLITYLSPTASFYEAFQGSLQATDDLFGEDSQQYQSVEDAWFAVGIYQGMDLPCTEETVLTDYAGTFSDGQDLYYNNTNCTWLIKPIYANQIKLTFTEFQTEYDYDFVYVYDGGSTNAPLLGKFSGYTIPDEIITSEGVDQMLVVFTSDYTGNFNGFEASYETITNLCDGFIELNENSGIISEGSSMNDYQNNSNCSWLINPLSATKIYLDFLEFNIQNDDFVKVYDGEDNSAPLLGEFTGDVIPNQIISTNEEGKMYIEFFSNNENTSDGWTASYEIEYEYCDGFVEFTQNSGTFSDGSNDGNYQNNSNCSWLINPSNTYETTLSFQEFNLFIGDHLYVYDGEDENAPLLVELTGNNIPNDIVTVSSLGKMFVKFTSDQFFPSSGWTASYTTKNAESCDGLKVLTQEEGVIYDGVIDENYPNNNSCSWLIDVEDAAQIFLDFTFFDLASGDYVRIYDGDNSSAPLLAEYTENSTPVDIQTTFGNSKMFIEFLTDDMSSAEGWLAEYSVGYEYCSGFTELASQGYITDGSGYDANYQNSADCSWLIDSSSANSIRFYPYQLDLAENDFIRIYNGEDDTAELLKEYSHTNGGIYETPLGVNKVFIKFTSDEFGSDEGFKLKYEPNYKPCHGFTELTDPSGVFTDGSNEEDYSNNTYCKWHIKPENAVQITINFTEFNIENDYDFVRIYKSTEESNQNIIGTYTGNELPEELTTPLGVGEMLIKFSTDDSYTYDGWEINYTSIIQEPCEGFVELNAEEGILYDGSGIYEYENNSECSWLINVEGAAQILLNFTEFNLENDDYLRIYDGEDETSPLLGEYTGATIPSEIQTTYGNNKMFVTFESNEINSNSGWWANYKAGFEYCNDFTLLVEDSGEITDGSGPNFNYQNLANCSWLINPIDAEKIRLRIGSFTLAENDYIRIYDGEDETAPLLCEFSQNVPVGDYFHSSLGNNKVLVKFSSDEAITTSGWNITYNSTITNCNGFKELTSDFGVFSDGSGDDNYQNYSGCTWLISPEDALQISLNFTEFSINPVNDHIKIYDGPYITSPLLGEFSGYDIPEEIKTSFGVGQMLVKFHSDYSGTSSGWRAEYTSIIEEYCSGLTELNEEIGYLYDGSIDEDYLNNSNCSWLINVENAAQIFLNFTELDVVENDFIRVYDGPNTTSPLLGEFTGNNIPDEVQSSYGNNQMYVEFIADGNETASGWLASYYVGYEYCNEEVYLTEETGTFSDGSGDDNYQNEATCSWHIFVDDSDINGLWLTFSEVNLSINDYIKVYDGENNTAPLIAEITGNEIPDALKTTIGNKHLFVEFISDESGVSSGWEASYETYTSYCSDLTVLDEISGTFSDGSEEYNYQPNTNCQWLISPENANRIFLNFTHIDLNTNDVVKVYDGNTTSAPEIGSFSIQAIPEEISTSFGVGEMLVVFDTFDFDGYEELSGWEVVYTSEILEPCDGMTVLNEKTGYLYDSDLDENYLNNSNCSWLIDVEEAAQIFLEFEEFNLSNTDYVRVYDGADDSAPLLGEFTGNSIPENLQSSFGNNKLFVTFISDNSITESGWYASYYIGYEYCEGLTVLTDEYGNFTDGSEEEQYQNSANCSWLIDVPEASSIKMSTSNFKLAENDVIRIYDGENDQAPLLKEISHEDMNVFISVETSFLTNKMYIHFESDEIGRENGWTINYHSKYDFCEENILLTELSGTINDNSGDELYNPNTSCSWLIDPEEDVNQIYLTFTEFDIAWWDYVKVYDGPDINADLLGEFTGDNFPEQIKTSQGVGQMFIVFETNDFNNKEGWEAEYTSVLSTQEQYCIELTELTSDEGQIDDGSEQFDYVSNTYCSWLIAPVNKDITTLTFTEFETESNYDYVKIYDGVDASAPLLDSFSGSYAEGYTVSTNNTEGIMFIEFITNDEVNFGGWSATYNTTIGTEEYELANLISIYPNPTDGMLFIYSKLNYEVEFKILDILGKVVYDSNILLKGENTIDLSYLSKGIYNIEFCSNSDCSLKKIVLK
ncbi:CUB domain-containing protein [Aureivirga sp. CE67]|uniref:CUB domain-containing protein n=1 Tax=Aureivirga sp. CE67 TaxID=1788983 RepID=UPI0018C9B601|nr:CUB domain-containing protein [Aureivirga sp. CE67]